MATSPTLFRELAAVVGRHRELTWEMTKREVTERYAGGHVGSWWALAHPLILAGVYIFLFGYVFRARIGATGSSEDYILYLLSGLVPWMAFQESMSKGTVSIVANGGIVKQVVFPLQILPVKGVFAAVFTQLILTLVVLVIFVLLRGTASWTFLLVPLLLAIQVAAMSGVSFVLSAGGAFVRDLRELVQIFALVGLYTAPIAYDLERVPDAVRPLFMVNPFSHMVWVWQDACYHGAVAHPISWAVFPTGSLVTLLLGFTVFQRLRPYFGSAL